MKLSAGRAVLSMSLLVAFAGLAPSGQAGQCSLAGTAGKYERAVLRWGEPERSCKCPYDLVVDAHGKFLYSSDGCNSNMLTFRIAANGALSSPSVSATLGVPLHLALVNLA